MHRLLSRSDVGASRWLARTVSPDYSQTVCCSGGIIRPDCATRSGCPSLDLLGVLQEYACGDLSRDVAQRTPGGASTASRRQPVNNPG